MLSGFIVGRSHFDVAIFHLTSFEVEVINAHEFAILAVLSDSDNFTVGILHVGLSRTRFNHSMGVTAHHDIDVVALGHQARVARLTWNFSKIANVRHHHHIIHFLHFLQIFCGWVGNEFAILIVETIIIAFRHHTSWIHVNADEAHTLSAKCLNQIWHHTLHWSGTEIVVGRNHWGFQLVVVVGKFHHAIIKLVISERDHVVAHAVDSGKFHLSLEHREIERALHGIATMNNHRVFVFLADLVVDGTTTKQSAFPVSGWVDLTVSVVDSSNHQMFGTYSRHHCSYQ